MTMYSLISWMNSNDGFVLGLLTLVYVLATIILAGFGWWSNRLAAKNIQQTFVIEKAKNRPYLVFDIIHRSSIVFAVIKNVGVTPASNSLVSISPELEGYWDDTKRVSPITSRKFSFLAPDTTLEDVIDSSINFYSFIEIQSLKVL